MTVKKWQSPDSISVGAHIAAGLLPHAYKIAHNNCLLAYTSDDMSKGINVTMLAFWTCIIAVAMTLDPRGGYFKQKDCEEAFQIILADVDVKAHVEAEAHSRLFPVSELFKRGTDVSFREEYISKQQTYLLFYNK